MKCDGTLSTVSHVCVAGQWLWVEFMAEMSTGWIGWKILEIYLFYFLHKASYILLFTVISYCACYVFKTLHIFEYKFNKIEDINTVF